MRICKAYRSKIKKLLAFALTAASTFCTTVYASSISSSKIATGTTRLVSDATSWLLVLAPAVSALLIIYYLIRKGMSDEMEHKKWNSRIVVTIVSCIGAVVASVLINVLVSYYK